MKLLNENDLNINLKLFNGSIDLTFVDSIDYHDFIEKLNHIPGND